MKKITVFIFCYGFCCIVFGQTYLNILGGKVVQTDGALVLHQTNLDNQSEFTASGGTLIMKATSGASPYQLGGVGVTQLNNLTINQNGRQTQLAGDVTVADTVSFLAGHLDLNTYTLTLGTASGTIAGEDETKSFIGSNGGYIQKTVTLTMPTAENPGNIGATVTSGADLGLTVIKRGHAVQSVNGKPGVARYYTITPTTNTGLDATVRLAYLNSELNGTPAPELEPFQHDGTAWAAHPISETGTNYLTTANLDALHTLTLARGDVRLNAKAFLQGPYSAGLMKDDLRSKNLIPLTEPYTGLGFTQVNGGGETTTASVLSTIGNDAVVDWVLLELRDPTDATVVLHTRSALVQRDGDIVDVDGNSAVAFPLALSGSYFVAVRHRNHLGIMGLNAPALSRVAVTLDFSSLPTYGTGAQTDLGGGVMGMRAGNADGNNLVRMSGPPFLNDGTSILNFLGSYSNVVFNTYHEKDVNLDGNVRASGPPFINDLSKLLAYLGNYSTIIIEQLP